MHLVDTTMFFSPRGGGVKQYLFAKQAWLERHAQVRHTILVPGPSEDLHGVLTCDGPAVPLLDGYRFPLSVPRWRDALLDLSPDLIEAGDPYVAGHAARVAGQRLGIPVVAFFHSDLPRMLSQRIGNWIAPVARMYLRNLYGDFDRVLAPSNAMLEKLDHWGIRNCALQPLGVNTQVFSPQRKNRSIRRLIGVPEDTRLLVYAGRFAPEKNIAVLERAVARLDKSYHLLLVGGRHFARVHPQITEWPYQRDAARLARILASCDALVHAGDQETFGLIAIEAMACGLPVVAVGMGGMKELVNESVGALIPRPSAKDMADAVIALFQRDHEALRRSARQHVLRSHDWDAAFRKLVHNYAGFAGRSILPSGLQPQPEG